MVVKWHNIWCPLGLVKPLDRSVSEPFEEAIPDQRVTMVERAYEKGTWWLVRGFDGLTTTSPVEIVPEVEVSKHKTCFCVHPGDNKEYGIALTLTRNASSLSQFQTDSQSTKHCNNPSKKNWELGFFDNPRFYFVTQQL